MKKFGRISAVLFLAVLSALAFVAHSEAMMGGGGGMIGGSGWMTGSGMIEMPTAEQMVTYAATAYPIMGADMASTMPVGVGSVAMGGNMVTVHATLGQFSGPVDMYFMIYAPAMDPFNVYMMRPDGTVQPSYIGVVPWMQGVTGVNQDVIGSMPVSTLPKGTYTLGLMVIPSGATLSSSSSFYMWMTDVTLQ